MGLDLIVLIPEAATSYEQALSIYHSEHELGEPSSAALLDFVAEVDSRFGDDDWPFAGDPLVFADHVSLDIAHERWVEVAPKLTELAHSRSLIVLDPQEERLVPPTGRHPRPDQSEH